MNRDSVEWHVGDALGRCNALTFQRITERIDTSLVRESIEWRVGAALDRFNDLTFQRITELSRVGDARYVHDPMFVIGSKFLPGRETADVVA